MRALYRTEELRLLEARARSGLPAGALMRRAGAAAADTVESLWQARYRGAASARADMGGAAATVPGVVASAHVDTGGASATIPGAVVLLLCGPGDNGGDGFACALELQQRGHHCRCWAPLPSGSADAQGARQRWEAAGGTVETRLPVDAAPDLVVDALLGIGATRPLDADLLAALRWTQARALPLVALDLPSGLDADTGTWIGAIAGAPATVTVTFLADKPGLHLRDGLRAAGDIRVADLGVDAAQTGTPAQGALNDPAGFTALLQRRLPDVNKGSHGTVAVAGGAPGMVGAVLLAGRAAVRLGAGKVFVDCLGAPELRVDLLQPELMLQPGRAAVAGEVLVAGCGMGAGAPARQQLAQWLAHDGPALFDADALNALAGDATLRELLCRRTHATVLTPHPGEAARLLQTSVADIQSDRVASAVRLARETRAIVVLKGAGSVIATPSGTYAINPTGGPALASAGTGDVLAGIAGALLAQCADPLAAVRAAVWLHGRAADLHGSDVGLVASEVAGLAVRAWEIERQRADPHPSPVARAS